MTVTNGTPPGFDIASIKCDDTATFTVRHPATGQPIESYGLPWEWTIAATWSDAGRKAQTSFTKAQGELALVYGEQQPPVTEAERLIEQMIAMRVTAWTAIDLDGQERAPCNQANVERVLELHPWLADDVWAFMQRREVFFGERVPGFASGLGTRKSSRGGTKRGSRSRATGGSGRASKVALAASTARS